MIKLANIQEKMRLSVCVHGWADAEFAFKLQILSIKRSKLRKLDNFRPKS